MKYRSSVLALCILLIALILCGCGNKDAQTTPADTVPSGGVTDVTNVESSVSTPDETGAVISRIDGFTAELDSEGEAVTYAFADTSVAVTALGSYTGKYVEDGSDEPVENVLAIVVQNTGDKPVQYATVSATDSAENEYTFVLSTLPAGCSALVLEAEKKTYSADMEISDISADVTECDELSLASDKVRVTFDGEYLHLENLTDTDYRAVYVRYKNYTAGNVYLGGITYNASFESVAAGGSFDYNSAHFYTGGSQVLMVQIVE